MFSSVAYKEESALSNQQKEPQETKVSFGKESRSPKKTRIPFNFAVTDEMREWARLNVPDMDFSAATEDFYEYWSNLESKKAWQSDWFLTWKRECDCRPNGKMGKKWNRSKKQSTKQNSSQANKRRQT